MGRFKDCLVGPVRHGDRLKRDYLGRGIRMDEGIPIEELEVVGGIDLTLRP